MGANPQLQQGQVTIDRILKDPEFLALPKLDKMDVMQSVDPDFKSMPIGEQFKVVTDIDNSYKQAPSMPLGGQIAQGAQDIASTANILPPLARGFLQASSGVAGALQGLGENVPGLGGVGDYFDKSAQGLEYMADQLKPVDSSYETPNFKRPLSLIPMATQQAVQSLPYMAATGGAMSVAGMPGAMATMGTFEGGQQYRQLRNEGIEPNKAILPSIGYGGVAGALEYLPFHNLMKILQPESKALTKTGLEAFKEYYGKKQASTVVKNLGKQALTEGWTEGAQQLAQNATGQMAGSKVGLWDDVLNSAIVGGASGAVTGAVTGAGADYVHNKAYSPENINNAYQGAVNKKVKAEIVGLNRFNEAKQLPGNVVYDSTLGKYVINNQGFAPAQQGVNMIMQQGKTRGLTLKLKQPEGEQQEQQQATEHPFQQDEQGRLIIKKSDGRSPSSLKGAQGLAASYDFTEKVVKEGENYYLTPDSVENLQKTEIKPQKREKIIQKDGKTFINTYVSSAGHGRRVAENNNLDPYKLDYDVNENKYFINEDPAFKPKNNKELNSLQNTGTFVEKVKNTIKKVQDKVKTIQLNGEKLSPTESQRYNSLIRILSVIHSEVIKESVSPNRMKAILRGNEKTDNFTKIAENINTDFSGWQDRFRYEDLEAIGVFKEELDENKYTPNDIVDKVLTAIGQENFRDGKNITGFNVPNNEQLADYEVNELLGDSIRDLKENYKNGYITDKQLYDQVEKEYNDGLSYINDSVYDEQAKEAILKKYNAESEKIFGDVSNLINEQETKKKEVKPEVVETKELKESQQQTSENELQEFSEGRHTGKLYTDGKYIYKPFNKTEVDVYDKLNGVGGIPKIEKVVVDGKEYIKYNKYEEFIDTGKRKESFKDKLEILENYLKPEKLNKTFNELSQRGISYNDQIQVAIDKNGNVDLIDFSNAMFKTPEEAIEQNLNFQSIFYDQIGLDKQSEIISDARHAINVIKLANNNHSDTVINFSYTKNPEIAQTIIDKKDVIPNNIYYSTNRRGIQLNINKKIQLDFNSHQLFITENKLTPEQIKSWELEPIIESQNNSSKNEQQAPQNNNQEQTFTEEENIAQKRAKDLGIDPEDISRKTDENISEDLNLEKLTEELNPGTLTSDPMKSNKTGLYTTKSEIFSLTGEDLQNLNDNQNTQLFKDLQKAINNNQEVGVESYEAKDPTLDERYKKFIPLGFQVTKNFTIVNEKGTKKSINRDDVSDYDIVDGWIETTSQDKKTGDTKYKRHTGNIISRPGDISVFGYRAEFEKGKIDAFTQEHPDLKGNDIYKMRQYRIDRFNPELSNVELKGKKSFSGKVLIDYSGNIEDFNKYSNIIHTETIYQLNNILEKKYKGITQRIKDGTYTALDLQNIKLTLTEQHELWKKACNF